MEAAGIRYGTYGSDRSGMVWGFLFSRGAPAQVVGSEEALEWMQAQARQDPDEFLWLHFNLSNTASEKWLRSHAGLPDEFWEALHQGSRSTRIDMAENTLIAVVNDVLHNFSFEASEISTMWLNVTKSMVVSARRSPLQSIERLHQNVKNGEPIRSPLELLTLLLRSQADMLEKIVRESVARVDGIEDSLLAGRLGSKRETLGTMRRVLVRLQRLLAPEPAALFRLLQKPPHWMAEADTQELRQSTEEFSLVLSDMSSLQERIKLLQEELAARVNEENSRSLYVLTIVTVMALPINLLAGLFGMNVGGIPLGQDPNGFWTIIGVIAAFTVVAGGLVVRMQRNR